MKIEWYGQACFMITSENGTKVLMDPFNKMLGYELPEIEADIVSTSHEHKDHNNVDAVKSSFILINKLGTFNEKGIEIKGVETFHDNESGAKKGKNTIYNFKIDGLNVCHCGDLGHILSEEQVKEIGNVDILLLPVGGGFTVDASNANEVRKQLNPTVIIPMHYRTKALGILGLIFAKVDKFIKVSGLKSRDFAELNVNKENLKEYEGIAVLDYK
ncbi:MBL fold metallo-hydrolase [Clostridium paridis]|uniref:MBL fold metallo-hydrolase n=1 Tax=Clostridium paridis TaxID=2803863 RepID=A0A937K551_9CLOT|nr:MBL fold metallo-hydrolase [Clostridium paridis]MBL4933327.1 MBL fold metallo-hydrolase [Clostridium paridis]